MPPQESNEPCHGVDPSDAQGAPAGEESASSKEFWDAKYGAADRVWSGNPNQALVTVVTDLPTGRSLDLGCGEGGDVIWLAERGWQATGVDISSTAIERATQQAAALNIASDSARFITHDVTTFDTEDRFDLVTASFLHSAVALERNAFYNRAAGLVAPGGHLLIIGHAGKPPWVPEDDMHEHMFLSPEETSEEMNLDPEIWVMVRSETFTREVTTPDGKPTTLDDTIVFCRRLPVSLA